MQLLDFTATDAQLTGMVRYSDLCTVVRRLSDKKSEIAASTPVERRLRAGADPYNEHSLTHALLHDAAQTISVQVYACKKHPIDTTDPATWLALEDIITCANRLVNVPDYYDTELGVSSYDLIASAAVLLDIIFSLTDRSCVQANLDVNRYLYRYLDLLVGRASIWISMVELFGCEAAATRHMSWAEAREAYAAERLRQYMAALARINAPIEAEVLTERTARMFVACSDLLNTQQMNAYATACSRVSPDDWQQLFELAYDIELCAEVGDVCYMEASLLARDFNQVAGWCDFLQITPLMTGFMVPMDTARDVQALYGAMTIQMAQRI